MNSHLKFLDMNQLLKPWKNKKDEQDTKSKILTLDSGIFSTFRRLMMIFPLRISSNRKGMNANKIALAQLM